MCYQGHNKKKVWSKLFIRKEALDCRYPNKQYPTPVWKHASGEHEMPYKVMSEMLIPG
jgi:hypothetical protein